MKKSKKKPAGTDYALIISLVLIIIFTIVVLVVFWHTGAEPSTLVGSFFLAFTFEGGFCAYIEGKKQKRKELEEKDERGSHSEDNCSTDRGTDHIFPDPLVEDEGGSGEA